MRIYVDLDSLNLVQGPGNGAPVTALKFKRGTQPVVELQFVRGGVPELLPAGTVIRFGPKETGKFDGPFQAFTDAFTAPGDVEGFYTARPSFNTTEINTLLASPDANALNDVPAVTLMAEFSWRLGAALPEKCETFDVVIANAVDNGSESAASEAGPSLDTRISGLETDLPDARRVTTGRLALGVIPKLDLRDNALQGIDARIAGLTPAAAKPIYTTQVHTGGGSYTRNPGCWAADLVGLTALSPWNAQNGVELAGVAVSPRHIVLAEHFVVSSGLRAALPAVFRFVGADGTVANPNVTDILQVGSTDIAIGILDEALPAGVEFLRVLPPDYADFFSLAGLPVLKTDKEEKALVSEIMSVTAGTVTLDTPAEATRATFHEAWVTGDSGSPACLVLGNELVLLAVAETTQAGDALAENEEAMNAVMTTLGGGYQMTRVDLAAMTQYLDWDKITNRPSWTEGGGPALAGSTGGNGTADAGKFAVFRTEGGLRAAGTGSVASFDGTRAGTGAAFRAQVPSGGIGFFSFGEGSAAIFGSQTGIPLTVSCGESNVLATFTTTDGEVVEALGIGNRGQLSWSYEVAKVATRASLAVPAVVTKTTTGDPAAPTGSEPTIAINTFDNNVKIYADGAWRQLATW